MNTPFIICRFRPLAGIMVLISLRPMHVKSANVMFPSPCGDYGSYPPLVKMDVINHFFSFRPLAGIMVLISKGF